jgi:hypothetical protein
VGTEKLGFSFLAPERLGELSNCPEIARLPYRQPLEAAADPCVEPCVDPWVVSVADGAGIVTAGSGGTADNFRNCVVIKVTTRCRSGPDSFLL